MVEDEKCHSAGLIAPPSSQSCQLNPDSICFGANYATTGVKDGVCVHDWGCRCRSGLVGASCSEKGEIIGVETNGALFSEGIPVGEQMLITWNSSMSLLPQVRLVLIKDQMPAAAVTNGTDAPMLPDPVKSWLAGQYISARAVANSGFYQWTVGDGVTDLPMGAGYRIRVVFSQILYQDSEPFAIADACAYTSCGVHGVCSMGKCVCLEGYDGPQCTRGPCERAGCDPANSVCNNTLSIVSGSASASPSICQCLNGYSGPQCRTPPECKGKINCANGGDANPQTLIISPEAGCSGSCRCLNGWGGDKCETCNLQCEHGKPDASCTNCVCDAGWTGDQCSCRYYNLKMQLNTATDGDDASKARFIASLQKDMAIAAQQTTGADAEARVAALESKGSQTEATVHFGPKCINHVQKAEMSMHNGVDHTAEGDNIHEASGSTPLDVHNLYLSMVPAFEDTDSSVYNGQATAFLSQSAAMQVEDPTGEQELVQPPTPKDCFNQKCMFTLGVTTPQAVEESGKSHGLTGAALIGVATACAIVGALLLVGGGFFLWRRHVQNKRRELFRSTAQMTAAQGN